MESAEVRGPARILSANRGRGGADCLLEAAANAGRKDADADSKWIVNLELARRICNAKALRYRPGSLSDSALELRTPLHWAS